MLFTNRKRKDVLREARDFTRDKFNVLWGRLVDARVLSEKYVELDIDNEAYKYRERKKVDLIELEKKVDLLLDHLDLEYEPAHECGPSLKPKQENEEE